MQNHSAQISVIIAQHCGSQGPLLPILNDVQAALGHVSDDAIRQIADALNLTRAEVHGVVSFYHDYKRQPAAKPALKICRAEACKANGVEALLAALDEEMAAKVSLETVYCLGLCANGPNALAGERPYARLDAAKLTKLIGELT